MRRDQAPEGEGEEPGEIGGSSIEIITLVERGEGERMGTAMLSTVLFHSTVILLFIYLFLSSSLVLFAFQDPSNSAPSL